MTSQEKQLEIDRIQAAREEANIKYSSMDAKRSSEYKIIEDKYKEESDLLTKEIEELKDKYYETENEMRQLVKEENWNEAQSRGVVNEFYINSIIDMSKIDISFNKDIKQKKVLKNGIDVWLISAYGFKLYLALYKRMLVGVSFRRTAEHAGDGTIPYSFIGQLKDVFEVTKIYEKGYSKGHKYITNATYTDWMKSLDDVDPEEINLIPLNQETFDILNDSTKSSWTW